METNQQHRNEEEDVAADLLVGGDDIRDFLRDELGFKPSDPYYLRRKGFPIGKSGSTKKSGLIASKRRIIRHIQKLAAAATS